MLNCKEATRLCSEQMEQKLSLQQKMSLRMHLLLCSACRNFATQIGDIRQVMHSYSQGQYQNNNDIENKNNNNNDKITPNNTKINTKIK